MTRDDDIGRFLAGRDGAGAPSTGGGPDDDRTVVVAAAPGDILRVHVTPAGAGDGGTVSPSYEALARQSYEALTQGVEVDAAREMADDGDHGDGTSTDDGHDDDSFDPPPERRRWRRRLLVVGGVAVLAAGAAGAVVVVRGTGGDDPADVATTATALDTVAVERRTLEEHAELDGTLGYGDPTQLIVPARGTVTGLPEVGSVVDRGGTLVQVDGKPVPLLLGETPLWRALGPGVTAGVDVEQLEANLVALGVASESELTVDQAWDDATTAAVEEWQAALGLEATGTFAPGSVVFQPAAVRVAEHLTAEGGALGGGPVLAVTGTTKQVTVDLEATRQDLLAVDQAVDIELPDGSTTTGTVQEVGRVAQGGDAAAGGGGEEEDVEPTIEVTVALDDPAAGGELDQAPVTVRAVTSAAEDVLAVPLEALLVEAGGQYVVEVPGRDGTGDFVPVELGAFADGWVEVTGDIAEGDEVVVPVD